MEYEAREKAILDHNQFMFEAEQPGIERICRLQDQLLQNNRYDDLARSTRDASYRQKLFEEYGI